MKSLQNLIGFCLLLLTPLARGAEPTLEEADRKHLAEYEERERLTSGKAPVSDAIRWLKEWTPKGVKGKFNLHSGDVFAAACSRANPAELAELAAILAEFPPEAGPFDECFSAYSTAAFRLAVAKLKQEPVKVALPQLSAPPPKYLAALPPEMTEAWTQWNSINGVFTKLLTAASEEHKARGGKAPGRMETTLRKLILKPERDVWKELTLFEMKGGFCGIGMDSFYHLRNRGVLASLIADGRLVEALGATFSQIPQYSSRPAEQEISFQDVAKDFLTACGLDWELVFIGSMLPIEGDDFQKVADQITLRMGLSEISPWMCIAAEGSPRAVKLCLTLMRAKGFDAGCCLSFIHVATGVEEQPAPATEIPGLTIPGRAMERARRVPIPQELRDEALAIVTTHLTSTQAPRELHALLGSVGDHMVVELCKPLEQLMKHPAHPVAARARELLSGARLVAPDAAIAPPPPPLRFQVLNNGEPLAGTDLDISANEIRLTATTDATGHLRVPLDDVVDIAAIQSVSVRALPWSPEAANPIRLEDEEGMGIPGLDSRIIPRRKTEAKPGVWPGPWLDMEMPVQAGKDQEYKVSARTASLEIAFDPSSKVNISGRAKVRLVRSGTAYSPLVVELEGSLSETFTFENLQLQEYFVVVLAEGVHVKASNPIRIGSKGSVRLIKLEPGRSVKGVIVGLDEAKMDIAIYATLFQNGKPVDFPRLAVGQGWIGLPLGKYLLRYPSSLAREEEARKFGVEPDIEPKDRHGGIDHEFEITEKSPMVVDLGELRLKPETAKGK